ncbi:MAG: phage regulatory protein/antirepressor Ant [Bacteroidota bacterium]
MENQITLVKANQQGKDITTSLIVAEVFGKDHDKVCRDIKCLECSPEFNAANFGDIEYTDVRGRQQKAYEITKDGFSFLVMGYTGAKAAEFKEKFIMAFNQHEALLKNDDYIIERAQQLLTNRVKALENSIHAKEEQLKLQEYTISEQAPKVEYHDKVLQSQSLIATNIIAKEMGMSAVTLNKMLHEAGIIYLSGQTWVLYNKYQDKGLAGMKTFTYSDSFGMEKTSTRLYWTEKGREMIHGLFKPVSMRPARKVSKN